MGPLTNSARDLLSRTSRPTAASVSTRLPGLESLVHAIEVDNSCALPLWRECRVLLQGTGYVPIVTCFWGMPRSSWLDTIEAELPNAVSRFFFDEEVQRDLPGMRSPDPDAIIAAASEIRSPGCHA